MTDLSPAFRRINRSVGRAVHNYHMISDQDRIVIGVSGGKDSLTLLGILQERLKFIPVQYSLFPVYIDPGFNPSFSKELSNLIGQMGLKLWVEKTRHGILAHSPENRENPCFLCSRLRRQRLFELTEEWNCNKLAMGHHQDDLIETLFINICYAGQIGTILPSQPFFQGKFTLIRPLAYTGESLIRKYAADRQFPIFPNPCPSSGRTKRQEIRSILEVLYRNNRTVRGNIFRALHHVNLDYLLKSDNNTTRRGGRNPKIRPPIPNPNHHAD
jgi:tRNA 2-thiocytidine biosynthesis protein TtcA